MSPLVEIGVSFTRLGLTAFGGPAAHIALFEEAFVTRRQWLTREHFLDLLGATHLVPGPNSTEMAIHVGYVRAGVAGAIVAGVGFITPAFLAVLAVASAYVRYGHLPAAGGILAGVTPVVVAIIAGAAWRLGRIALAGTLPRAVALAVFALAMATPMGEVWLLAGAALAGLAGATLAGRRPPPPPERSPDSTPTANHTRASEPAPSEIDEPTSAQGVSPLLLAFASLSTTSAPEAATTTTTTASLSGLGSASAASAATTASLGAAVLGAATAASPALLAIFLVFLRIGALLFGSGYVLIAYLDRAIVAQRGWLDAQTLLDAIASGQITPGPVLATAAFVGYLLRGVPGAAVATVGIFLPSFLIVLAMGPLMPRLRRSSSARAVLATVNAAVVALIVAVLLDLSRTALIHPWSWALAGAALLAGLRWRVPGWALVLAGAAVGWLLAG